MERELSLALMDALHRGHGMNDFLHRFLSAAGHALSSPRLILYDYDEQAGHFDLLYFTGYPADYRSELTRRMHAMDLSCALSQHEPYRIGESGDVWAVPLYFLSILEALLIVDFRSPRSHLDELQLECCALISRFLGLFLSSSRLPVNQKTRLPAMEDFRRAREVQLAYLPAEHPVTRHYEIYGFNQSSALVGGDYFDYFTRSEELVQCVVADACGHGLAAALIMSTFRGLLHSELRQSQDFTQLFDHLNRQLYVGGELLQYLTAVFFDFDARAGTLRYFNAGHYAPLILHADSTSSELEGGGPPLGMLEDSTYEMREVPAQPGDVLVVFTDGLVDLHNSKEEFFGVEGIRQAVQELLHPPCLLPDMACEIYGKACRFSSPLPPEDDITLFLMRLH
jgi:phosphoserine phosphatase RsbU/P